MALPTFLHKLYWFPRTFFTYHLVVWLQKKSGHRLFCMNYGMVLPYEFPFELTPEEAKEKRQFQLYYYLLKEVETKGKSILEVGCGIGGGCYFMDKYMDFETVSGVDLLAINIKTARERNQNNKVQLKVADACKLTAINEKFDFIICVESSHAYPSFSKFLAQAHTKLKEGGMLLLADLRMHNFIDSFRNDIARSGFLLKRESDISELVKESLKIGNDQYIRLLGQSSMVKKLLGNVAMLQNSPAYKQFERNELQYLAFWLQK